MFTWICPKCGGEVPPAYDDCPRCSPKKASVAEAPTSNEAESVVPPSRPPVVWAEPSVKAPPPPAVAAQAPPVAAQTPPPAVTPARGVPPTMVAVAAFGGIAAILAVLYLYVLPGSKHTSAAGKETALEQPGPAGSATPVHPLAKHLELGGIRLEGVKGGQLKVQYVVVNHSAAELPSLRMIVALRSADRTFFEFPVTVPSLGPFETRDLTSTVKTELKPYEMPDWQMLRPQFRIETAP